LGNWEIGKLGNWEIGKLGNWEIGKLGNWEIGKLGNWEIGKAASRLTSLYLNFPISQFQNFPIFSLSRYQPLILKHEILQTLLRNRLLFTLSQVFYYTGAGCQLIAAKDDDIRDQFFLSVFELLVKFCLFMK